MLLNCSIGQNSWEFLEQQEIQPSILQEISPEYSFQRIFTTDGDAEASDFDHPRQRIDSLEKTLLLGNSKSRRESGWKVMRLLYGITNSMDVSLTKPGSWWRTTSGKPGVLQSILSQRVGHNWATELHWTEAFWPVRALEQESKVAVTGSDHKAPACLHAWLWVLGQADPFASTAN